MEDMLETPEIDIEKVMEQIRGNVRKRRQKFPPFKAANPLPTDQVATDLTSLHRDSDIYPLRFTSHRRVLGHFVVLAKKLLQQLLTPILERQLAFNTATARLTSSLWEQVVRLCQQQDTALQALQEQLWGGAQQHISALQALRAEMVALGQAQSDALQALRAQVAAGQQQQTALQAEVAALGQCQGDALQALRAEVEKGAADREARIVEGERTIAQLQTEGILQERRITLLLEEARKRLPDAWDQAQLQSVADEANHVLDALYVSFEDQFRGTRADIKERLRVYLPILQTAPLGSETAPILDVGCGRGEWLEVLQEAGLRGRGVDRNRVLIAQCQKRGLEVAEGDWLAYLHSVPDASLGAVTGFHIIEHLPWDVLIKLLDETVRVLIPGGVAIFETPNPRNVLVGSHNFYLDPTHRNPLPSAVMQFVAEARGLCRVKIIELHPYPAAFHVQETHLEVAQRFNEYFYGPQDYGVVGWKA
jgi:SAM-dependent methyltransferase